MKLSYIIPCYRSEETIGQVVQEIKSTMDTLTGYEYEIILINDSSPDDTFSVIKKLCDENDNITGLDMAKNFGQHAALMAGFHCMSGDIAICLDDDGQTPCFRYSRISAALVSGLTLGMTFSTCPSAPMT